MRSRIKKSSSPSKPLLTGSGNAKCHSGQLAVEFGNDLADGLGGAGRRRDDVLTGAASIAPRLGRGTVHGLLGRWCLQGDRITKVSLPHERHQPSNSPPTPSKMSKLAIPLSQISQESRRKHWAMRLSVRSFAPLTHALDPPCSIHSRAPLRSIVRSLTHFADPLTRGKTYNFRSSYHCFKS